ncbi:MAG: tyrosyl-tRNA synthetase [Phylliscum demangeonii]|nr:MAG: tyrosyl-tRNA synthetase [Phylliscum demangeonii]
MLKLQHPAHARYVRHPSLFSLCATCRRALGPGLTRPSAVRIRSISQNFHRNTAESERNWAARAVLIRAGGAPSMLSILEERGYVDTIVGDREALDRVLIDKRVGVYLGIDPTAPSMHLGHLVPMMALFWMHVHGYPTESVLGGTTARIGDPTDRLKTRDAVSKPTRLENMTRMHVQLKRMWATMEGHTRQYGYEREWAWRRGISNNNTWLNRVNVNEFYQVLGQGVRMGTMLGKESVRRRMEAGEGMSFAEFSYPLLQAWDWWHLFDSRGFQLQIGGSDQLGNIMTGIDMIKQILKTIKDPLKQKPLDDPLCLPYGFTTPLLTTASGEKFGKSAGNAVWLDQEIINSFDLYQHFLRLPDTELRRYLKLFTFLPLSQIESILTQHEEDPSLRRAHHVLAREVLALVHGAPAAKEAELAHRNVFQRFSTTTASGSSTSDAVLDVLAAADSKQVDPSQGLNLPPVNMTLPRSLVVKKSPIHLVYAAGFALSRNEAHKLVAKKGVYIGSRAGDTGEMTDSLSFTPITHWDPAQTEKYLFDGELLILRQGKWKVKVVKVVSDEEFDRLELKAPGWLEEKARQKLALSGESPPRERPTTKPDRNALAPLEPEAMLEVTPEHGTSTELEHDEGTVEKPVWPMVGWRKEQLKNGPPAKTPKGWRVKQPSWTWEESQGAKKPRRTIRTRPAQMGHKRRPGEVMNGGHVEERAANTRDAGKTANTRDAEKTANTQDAGKTANTQDAGKTANTRDAGKTANTRDAEKTTHLRPAATVITIRPEQSLITIRPEETAICGPTIRPEEKKICSPASRAWRLIHRGSEEAVTDARTQRHVSNWACRVGDMKTSPGNLEGE